MNIFKFLRVALIDQYILGIGGGVGEAALISALVGAGTSAATGGDPLKGALMGGITGGVMGGLSGAAAGTTEAVGSNVAANTGTGLSYPTPGNYGTAMITPNAGADMASVNAFTGGPELYQPQVGVGSNVGMNSFDAMNPGESGIDSLANRPYPDFTNAPTPTPADAAKVPVAKPSPNMFNFSNLTNTQLGMLGGSGALTGAMEAERKRFKVPQAEKYDGPLSKFHYDPSRYQPDIVAPPSPAYKARYDDGGSVGPLDGMDSGGIAALNRNDRFPMSQIPNSGYIQATQQPFQASPMGGGYDTSVDTMTGQENGMAKGGITSLGGYSDGGRMLQGPGDGMSDSIPASINNKQPARLADGEFVVPADVVSHLGNGSTDAGAKQLYSMMSKVRKARTGNPAQGKQIKPTKFLPA